MKKLLLLLALGCLWGGGSELWKAVFHGNPVAMNLSTSAAPDLPPYFTLTNVSIEPLDAVYYKQGGIAKALLPVRPAGEKDESPIHVLLATEDPDVLKLKDTPENNKLSVDILKNALAITTTWRAKKQIVGVPDSHNLKDQERQQLIKVQPLLAPDFVIVTEGKGPSAMVGLLALAAGVGFAALLFHLVRDKAPASVATAPPAVAEPPKP